MIFRASHSLPNRNFWFQLHLSGHDTELPFPRVFAHVTVSGDIMAHGGRPADCSDYASAQP
jgi:hypothetical protein